MALPDLIDTLTDLDVDEATPTELLGALSAVVTIRNLADHHAASITARIETLGIPEKQGRKIREILRDMGVAPYIAARWLRDGNALAATPELARMTGLGAMSGEHADAVVKGINHIDTRAREPLAADARRTYMTTLLAHATAGAIPSGISSLAREIGNTLTDEDPDGSRDARTPGQARSEAFETILDRASDADPTLIGAPKHQLLLTIPADTPDLATLDYVGPHRQLPSERSPAMPPSPKSSSPTDASSPPHSDAPSSPATDAASNAASKVPDSTRITSSTGPTAAAPPSATDGPCTWAPTATPGSSRRSPSIGTDNHNPHTTDAPYDSTTPPELHTHWQRLTCGSRIAYVP